MGLLDPTPPPSDPLVWAALPLPERGRQVCEAWALDGELVAGMTLGWNFGEGHLHHEQLLASLQTQCGFEPGELRCIFVESQPLFRSTLAYRIADAATGPLAEGQLEVAELRSRQPWSAEVAVAHV
jgi:hypothetical protein